MKLNRLSLSEATPKRIVQHLMRRGKYAQSVLSWKNSAIYKENDEYLASIRDKYKGERCVIICNGPSLNQTDMGLIKDETSFCMNRSYLMFDEWGFTPTYYSLTNELVLSQFTNDIRALPMRKFTDFSYRKMLRPQDKTAYFRLPPSFSDTFGSDLRGPITSGGTVTYATLQIAFHMGFQTAIIVGMDHRFKAKGLPSKAEYRKEEVDEDHVHPDYFPKGMKWELPDLYRSELAYRQARKAYEEAGRRIIDATVGGACQVFEKQPLEQALA